MTSPMHILLVEDTPSDIRLTQEALKEGSLKYELTVLNDGEQAMEYFRKVAGTDEQPDLVLLDLNMPKKNGHEVLAEMQEIEALKSIPVILLTVSRDEEEILHALDVKMNYYLGKPVTSEKLNTLLAAMDELSGSSQAGTSLTGEDAHVRYVMAGNPHTALAILTKLAVERNPKIRARVAENPNVSRELMEALANDPNAQVRVGVSENPSVCPDILDRLARDPSEDVRLNLASNPKTPRTVLLRLCSDEHPHIASMASKTLSNWVDAQKTAS
jgi:two-component system, chemotaxis family, response regulator Rcp1